MSRETQKMETRKAGKFHRPFHPPLGDFSPNGHPISSHQFPTKTNPPHKVWVISLMYKKPYPACVYIVHVTGYWQQLLVTL